VQPALHAAAALDGLDPLPTATPHAQRDVPVLQDQIVGIEIDADELARFRPGRAQRLEQGMAPQSGDVGGGYQELEFDFGVVHRYQLSARRRMR